MVTRTGPSRLTARERARRAARGGASRSVPAPLLAPALIAVGFLVLPLVGLLIRAPWRHLGAALSGSDATQALVLSLWTASVTTAISLVIGVPLASPGSPDARHTPRGQSEIEVTGIARGGAVRCTGSPHRLNVTVSRRLSARSIW